MAGKSGLITLGGKLYFGYFSQAQGITAFLDYSRVTVRRPWRQPPRLLMG